jgi:hypothetical protein
MIPDHLSPAMKQARATILAQGGALMSDGVTRVDILVSYIPLPDMTRIEAACARILALLERSDAFRECYGGLFEGGAEDRSRPVVLSRPLVLRSLLEGGAELVALETYEVTAVRAGLQVFQRLVPSEHLLKVLATHEALLGAWLPAEGVCHD